MDEQALIVEIESEQVEGMKIETVKITDRGTVVRRVYPETTKHCPICFNDRLMLLRTFNIKWCCDCNTEIVWPLKEGQKALA